MKAPDETIADLRTKIDRLQSEFESYKIHLPGAVVEILLEPKRPRVVFLNRIAEVVFGFSPEDVERGLMFWEMVATEAEFGRIVEISKKYFGESVFGEKPYRRSKKQELFEFQMRRKSGETFFAEVQTSVVMDENKIPYKIVAVFRDISRRKQLERDKEHLIQDLQDAIEMIKKIQGFSGICSSCHRIENRDGQWVSLNEFLLEQSDFNIRDNLCPDCDD